MTNTVNTNWLNIIESIASILGSLGVFILTAYAFWLYHFSKKIKVTSLSPSSSMFFGYSFNFTIINKTMSPKNIQEIIAVFDNKYQVKIKKFDEPFLLEPLKTYNISGNKYSAISTSMHSFCDTYFILDCFEKPIYVKYRGKIRNKKSLQTVGSICNFFDNEVLSDGVNFVLIYWHKDSKEKTKVFITDTGIMDKTIYNFNGLPKKVVTNTESIGDFFNGIFEDPNINFQVYDVSMNNRMNTGKQKMYSRIAKQKKEAQ